ncbi:Uncharacterised protein [Salmonella enterica subsp. enterica serovar Bredeney]|nr:Uncharacterised protein [Salmonella enterica subsp. enterica serovar Bredeney]
MMIFIYYIKLKLHNIQLHFFRYFKDLEECE